MDAQARAKIQETVTQNPVVLFMKGTREAPQCGFSATVVGILDSLLDEYLTVNVLADESIRQGIKEYSEWPTIPQLYVKGEFVGGCDIVKDLFAEGQLEQTLGLEPKPIATPAVTVTDSAALALTQSLSGVDEVVRLDIDARYNHGLSIGQREAKDIALATSIPMVVDRASAKRAEGVVIDFVSTPNGQAFKITNPNEPPRVRQVNVKELESKLAAGNIELFDVRTEQERQTAVIAGSRLLDRAAQNHIMSLSKDTPLYFHCHHGTRSQQAAEFFVSNGFKNVFNVAGGIDAWSQEVDPKVPRY